MDYTPMASYGVSGDHRQFTLAHMAALPVVFEAGVQCMADKPDVYRAHPAYEHYFKNMPSDWDDSILVDGEPAAYVNFARRSGDDWYQGIICDAARNAEFSLDFLGEGTYTAYIYTDGEDPMETVDEEIRTVTKDDTLNIPLAETGGAAIHYVKTAEEEPVWDTNALYSILSSLKDAGIEVNSNNTSPGAIVDLWWNFAGDSLFWRLIPDANQEYYRIQPGSTTVTVLMPTDSEVAVNTKLTVGNIDDADDSQWWKIVEAEDGTYRILNKKAELAGTPLYIATDSDSTTDGAPIVLADESAASSKWNLVKKEEPEPEPVEPAAEIKVDQSLLNVGDVTDVTVSVTDSNSEEVTEYTVESSNPAVLEVTRTADGITAEALSNGTASIVVRADLGDGVVVDAYAQVIVGTEPVEGSVY